MVGSVGKGRHKKGLSDQRGNLFMATVAVVRECGLVAVEAVDKTVALGELDSPYTLPVDKKTRYRRQDIESLARLALTDLYQRLGIPNGEDEARGRCEAIFHIKGSNGVPKTVLVEKGNVAVIPFSSVLSIHSLVGKIPIGGRIDIPREKLSLFHLSHSVQMTGILFNVNLGFDTVRKSFVRVRSELFKTVTANGRANLRPKQLRRMFLGTAKTVSLLIMLPSLLNGRGVCLPLSKADKGDILFFRPASDRGTVLDWRGIPQDSVRRDIDTVYPSYSAEVFVA